MTVNDQLAPGYAGPAEDVPGAGRVFRLRAVAVDLADDGFAAADVETWGAGGSTARIWAEIAGQMAEAEAGAFDVAAFREQMVAEDERLCGGAR
jgi:hypothetical protein